MEMLFVALMVAGVVGAAALSWYLKERRRHELAGMAHQLGLAFSRQDPFGLLGLPFALFAKGDGRGIENVLHGTWQGLPLKAFDYWYYERSTDPQGRRTKTYHRFNAVITEIDAACSPLRIERENVLTRVADALGFRDIEFETEDFNRAFQVEGKDRKFASDLCDARMMAWLLRDGGSWSYELVGPWVLVSCKRLRPTQLIPLLGTAKGFVERIPRVVFSLYAKDAAG
jgi:hypothetical protein